tara:strand:- start:3386 stop:4063 length:678 start_codon:yes stop_codon:yes gene_type:complete
MKKILFTAVITAGFLSACATPSYNYKPELKEISKPPIGKVATANLGDHMLTQGIMVQQDAIYIDDYYNMSGNKVSPGYFAKQGEDEEFEQYKISGGVDAGTVTKGLLKDPPALLVVRKEDNALCVLTVYNYVSSCTADVPYQKTNWATANKNSFQQTLLYNGKVGNKINIGYREFSSDTARPAFNNDVEYDLSQSKEIGYKGALIDVIDADNKQIRYKVTKGFDK